MTINTNSVMPLYKGWDDYQISLVRTVGRLSPEQLGWRPAPNMRSVGEIVAHIIGGRIQWFHHTLGEGSAEFANDVAAWSPEEKTEENPDDLVRWLEATWGMMEEALNRWTASDMAQVYDLPPYQGKKYVLTRQWIMWRVLSHDIHHGGELAVMLGMQGISIPELGDEGGHLAERAPLAEEQ